MRQLGDISRRRFGALLGAKLLTLATTSWSLAHSKEHLVVIKRFKFDPVVLEVPVGATVTWENQDTAPHTATSDTGNWDTGKLTKSQKNSVKFDDAGTFEYYCLYHPHMKATIVVS